MFNKLTAALGGVGTLMAALAFIAAQMVVFATLWRASESLTHSSDLTAQHLEASASLARVDAATAEMLVTAGSSDSMKGLREAIKHFDAANTALGSNVDHWERANTSWPELEGPLQTMLAASDRSTGNVDVMIAYGRFTKLAGAVSEKLREDTLEFKTQFDRDKRRVDLALLIAAALCVAGTCAIFYMIYLRVTRPLRDAIRVAENVARGDLSTAVSTRDAGELAALMHALASMQTSLAGIVQQVQASTGTVASAAEQVSAASVDLSARTEEQASTLEETASSLEEFTATVRQTADNTRKASSLAAQASATTLASADVVNDAVTTMSGIQAGSKRIEEIVNVIDGIAFQTNILALNAAVEAARAGDHGRGFAVVAAEVRALAQRSAASAKEIKLLIADSVGQIAVGTRLVNDAGESMRQIRAGIGEVDQLIQDIARAAAEQAHGVEQVNRAVVQMENVTQQNASMVQQAASSADAMNEQAQSLRALVAKFSLADAGAMAVERRSSARPRGETATEPRAARHSRSDMRVASVAAPQLAHASASRSAPGGARQTAGEWEEF
ncbi:MAG: HAMP domain-containing protein [Betaproteobacteria bacterium]|nr:HAMP domain-containing protein [Betaproteobacteria bacterium]